MRVVDRASAGGAITQDVRFNYDFYNRKTLKRVDANGDGVFDRYTAWTYDGDHAVLEYEDADGDGTAEPLRLSNRYMYGDAIDMVLADEQYSDGAGPVVNGTPSTGTSAGETLWTLGDHLGSVRDVVDNNEIVRQHVVYDSFGNRISEIDRDASGAVISNSSSAAIDELLGYTGRDWDSDINLQYNRARWYDPASGRWLSQDPIGFVAGDANLYRYVGNQPLSYSDPSGLDKFKVIIKLSAHVEKVYELTYEQVINMIRARTRDACNPPSKRKYSGKVFVGTEDAKAAKELAEHTSPIGEAVPHPESPKGHPAHYHPGKRYQPNGKVDTTGTPHIGPYYDAATVIAMLENGADMIVDFTPIGDVKQIAHDIPEIGSSVCEIVQLTDEFITSDLKSRERLGGIGIRSWSDGISPHNPTNITPQSWRKPIP